MSVGGNQYGKTRRWTDDEDAFIAANAHLDAQDIADRLGRSVQAVYTRANRHIGVKLGYLSEDRAAREQVVWAGASRFLLARVEYDPFGGCWLWGGTIGRKGYGQTRFLDKDTSAHRLSWRAHHGEIPAGMVVCHRCDVRACVNPDHLFLGTYRDNMRDMREKGRQPDLSGERNSQAKITADQAQAIIYRLAAGEHPEDLAAEHSVSKLTIYDIRCGRSWAKLDRPDAQARIDRRRSQRRRSAQ